jgi:predicted transcriptional regulator of viral defense system
VAASTPSTTVGILLAGVNTYIGYGSTLKEYEILTITPTTMYLRVQGTETGNAWYLKMIPKP